MGDPKQIVLEFLKKDKQPRKSEEIAQATGLDKKEVSKVITKLKKEGLVVSPKRCYYQAKE